MAAECSACPAPYRPRDARGTPLYRLVEAHYEQVKGLWEERFESAYGFWRGFVDNTVYAFLDCGLFEVGFARVFCDACRSEYLVSLSCQRRGLCPSCAAKRAAIFGAFLREDILEEVGHAMWTFTIPKILRRYFLHDRKLLGRLSQAAWETVYELMAEAVGVDGFRPGMVTVVQSASDDLRWHPHVHGIASRGGWDRQGRWHPVSYVDTDAAERLFRFKVLSFLKRQGLLSDDRIKLLDSWRHSGFSVHNAITVLPEQPDAVERLARYLRHAPVSLQRLRFDEDEAQVVYEAKRSRRRAGETFDPLDFLARILMHIPEPRLHEVRYNGAYSAVARAQKRKAAETQDAALPSANGVAQCDLPSAAERQRLRRQWAQMIRRIFEVDPLTCKNCGQQMRVISFITDPPVIRKILDHLANEANDAARDPPIGLAS